MDETIMVVQKEPLVLLLNLPDGCTPGRWESAEAFSELITETRKRYPDKRFQFLPFSYDTLSDGTNPALDSILAVSETEA